MAIDLSKLNNEQKEAVLHNQGPLLIIAGAGTGKTTVITQRIVNIIETNCANGLIIILIIQRIVADAISGAQKPSKTT